MLSIELYLRVHSKQYESDKIPLLRQLPPKIAWDLVVAQRWLENMAIGRTESTDGLVTFDFLFHSKRRQVEALRDFAWSLKWPNMGEVEYILEENDRQETAIEYRSADAMSWFFRRRITRVHHAMADHEHLDRL